MDAEYRSSGPTHLVNNAGPTSASDFPFDVGLRAGAGSVDTVTSAWLALARARQIRAIAVAPGVVEAPRMSGLVASDLGDKIRARCLCNGLLSRRRSPNSSFSCSCRQRPMSTASLCRSMATSRSYNRRKLWRRRQIRRESTCQGDSKMRGRITTGAQERGGEYAIGPSR